MKRYWLIVASKDHVLKGVEAGFCQANHGKKAPMQKLQKGDEVLFYAGKEKLGEATPCQQFVAWGTVVDEAPFQVRISENFEPYRRQVDFHPVKPAPIRPLLQDLQFIPNPKRWGYPLRQGFLEITEEDFDMIRQALQE